MLTVDRCAAPPTSTTERVGNTLLGQARYTVLIAYYFGMLSCKMMGIGMPA